MTDTSLQRGDLLLHVDPDSGAVALRLGPIGLAGGCRAVVSHAGQRAVTVSGQRAVELVREQIAGPHGPGVRLTVRFADGPFDTGLRLEAAIFDEHPFAALRLGVLNHGVARVVAQSLSPLATTRVVMGDGPLDGWVNGFHSWSFSGYVPHTQRQPQPATRPVTLPQALNPTTRQPRRPGQYVGEWVAALIDPPAQALVAGFVGVERQFGQVYLDGRPGMKGLFIESTADGVSIGPGEVLWGEWAILYRVALPHPDPLGVYAGALTRLTPGRVPDQPPPAGWSGWYQFFDRVTLDDMQRNQEALVRLRDRLPLPLVQLDDGYQPAWGSWLAHNKKFPGGVQGWAEEARRSGFEPGLWLSPLTVDRRSDMFRERPEALLRTSRGRPAPGGYLTGRWLHGLDPTHPATQDFLRETFETVVHRWGIRYLKLDFLYCGALPGVRHDPNRTRAQALRDGLTLIREVAGEDAILLGCGCPFGAAVGLVDVMRVGPDVAPYWYPELFGLSGPLRGDFNLPSARSSLAVSLNRQWTHRRLWWLDADNLLVRKQQQLAAPEVQTLVTVVGMTGSHLVLGDDLPRASAERLRWAASLLPNLPGTVETPDLFAGSPPRILIRRCSGAAGPHTAVALINWSDRPAHFRVPRATLGMPENVPLLAFDFWQREARRLEAGPLVTEPVAPHGVVLLALRPAVRSPQLVGTDLHLSMGQEVSAWEVAHGGLRFAIDLGRKAVGSVWLTLPAPPTGAACDGSQVEVEAAGSPGVYRLPVRVDGRAEVTVGFEP